MHKKLIGLGVGVLISIAAGAQQQKDSARLQVLDEVVVTDSRFELKREHSGKTVIKIGAEELERDQGKSVAEVITAKSGIEISGGRSRQGEILGVFARGGRGRQVLILLDGVRISDPSSFSQEYDLRLLPLANIESIEIIKGAASTLYGTNAATAVINITTKTPSGKKISGNFQSTFGTDQNSEDQNYKLADFSNSARIHGTLNKLFYSMGFSNSFSDGLSSIITPVNEKDLFSRISTDISLGYQVKDKIKIGIYGNQTNVNTEYDESFGLLDADYRFISEQKRVGFNAAFLYEKGEINLNMALSEFSSENISAFPSTFDGGNYVLDAYNKYVFNDTFYTIAGINYNHDQTEFAETKDFTLLDPYVNMVYVSSFGLNLNSGARLNLHSEYGSHLVYSLNPSYSFPLQKGYFKVLASYATSYITPSLTQLFGVFGANEELEPESDRTIEGGVEYFRTGNLRVSTLYFNRKEENFVFFDDVNFQYLNAENTVNAQGVELEMEWQPIQSLSLSVNYTFTERQGDNAIRIPKHKINTVIGYSFSEMTVASFQYGYTGKRTDTDFNTFTDLSLEPYSLFGAYLSHSAIPGRLKVFFKIDNIFNTSYTEIIGFTTRGRNIAMGINLTL